MNQKRKNKISAREKKQARQARKIVNAIFIALIIFVVIIIIFAALKLTQRITMRKETCAFTGRQKTANEESTRSSLGISGDSL